MFNDIQSFLAEAGESGCYALCLINVAEEYLNSKANINENLDVIKSLKIGIDQNCIHYNWQNKNDNDNFFVTTPATFLYYLTGKHWEVRHAEPLPQIKENEFVINRYERKMTGYTVSHFERVGFKPIAESKTVIFGKLVSTRICKVTN